MKKVYLAGPDVFRPFPIEYGKYLKNCLRNYGFDGLYPFDNEICHSEDVAMSIYEANIKMINDSDIVLANMDRFRGPSLDPGTAFEMGYAKAKGKIIYGYYDNPSSSTFEFYSINSQTTVNDTHYPNVENFGLQDNLMIIKCLSVEPFDSLIAALENLKFKYGEI